MPAEPWVTTFRRQVKLATTTGWGVREMRGWMQLRIEGVASINLPYRWNETDSIPALARIQLIFKQFESEGLSLEQAANIAESKSSKAEQRLDWDELVAGFREFRPSAGEQTWRHHYLPVLNEAGALMTARNRKPPANGEELMMQALKRWEHGSRTRQIARRNLQAFLDWAVQRNYLKACYSPPPHQPEPQKPKRHGYPLSDEQILRLLDGVPDERWRFAIQLAATYGLRPEDLRHMRWRDGEVWSVYRKSQGGLRGAKTEPRRLHALPVQGALDWNLEGRLKIGEELPPLRSDGKAGQALRQYLGRREVWKALQAEAEAVGEQLVPYSFRHRFSKEAHRLGVPVLDICKAMGHSLEVHQQNYSRFIPDGTAAAFAKAVNS